MLKPCCTPVSQQIIHTKKTKIIKRITRDDARREGSHESLMFATVLDEDPSSLRCV